MVYSKINSATRKVISGLFLFLYFSSAQAEHSLIHAYNNKATISANAMYLHYDETVNGEVLDSVRGVAPGVELTLRKSFNSIFVEPSLSYFSGTLLYDGGYYDGGVLVADKKYTKNVTIKPQITFGYFMPLTEKIRVAPIVVYGYQRWDRELPPTGEIHVGSTVVPTNAYTEEYSHQYLGLGLEVQEAINNRWLLAVNLWGGTTINPVLFTNGPYGGGSLALNFRLKEKPISQLSVRTDYAANKYMHFYGELSYVLFRYGKSPLIGNVSEPNSTTQQVQAKVGVAFPFN